MNWKLIAAALLAVAIPVAAQAMTVAAFLQKADALKARGVAALFSRDISLLKNEVRTAAASLRTERDAAERAGRQPAFCPPPRGQASLNSDELLAYFRSLPPAQRQRTEVRDALRGFFARRYPCR
jgi:hypothetical protein